MIALLLLAGCGSSESPSIGGEGAGGAAGSGGAGGAGGPGGSGGAGGAGGSGGASAVCTSMTYWTQGDQKSDFMHPGRACIDCHVAGGKAFQRSFDVAGTVYPTAHEPDDCNGVNVTGATVVITDANGQEHPLPVNSAGNFFHADLFGFAKFPMPIKAKVVYQGKERVMSTPQMSGNCNSCHTAEGSSGGPGVASPGRIMLP